MSSSHPPRKRNPKSAAPQARSRRGAIVEDLAARYLEASGMRILARNVRRGRGEIDLIALDGEELVFVEVRSRRSGARFDPSALSRKKMERLGEAAEIWLAETGRCDALCRFDVLAVRVGADGYRFRHLRSAFVVED